MSLILEFDHYLAQIVPASVILKSFLYHVCGSGGGAESLICLPTADSETNVHPEDHSERSQNLQA